MKTEKSNICVDCKNASKCFNSLFPDELDFINSKKTQILYLKGETIFKQGAFSPYVLYVVDGLVKIFLQTSNTKQLNLRLAKQGDFLAFSSIFNKSVYNYSAMAVKDSTLCMIDKSALKQLLMKNTAFAIQISTRNSSNEERYLDIIKNLSDKHMRGKLASALLYLSSNEFLQENCFQFLNRQDIADFASISMESAVKFLKEFEKEGLLELSGKDIRITNKNKLDEIERNG